MSIIIVLMLAGLAYYWYNGANTATAITKYVVEDAAQGSVVTSVSGSGQIQAGTTLTISPKVSETVTSIAVKVGDHVRAGQLLIQLDPTTEQRAVDQAKLALQSAQLSAEEVQQIATSTLLQEQGALAKAQQSLATASTTLAQDYQSGFDSLGPTFVDFQTLMVGLGDFATGNEISKTQDNPDAFVGLLPDYLQAGVIPYKNTVQAQYTLAVNAYQQNLIDYHAATRNSSTSTLSALFSETANTAKTITDMVKAGKDLLNEVINTYHTSSSTTPLPNIVSSFQTSFGSYTNTANSDVSGIQGVITGIANDSNAILDDQSSLAQASETLSELIAGPTQTTLLSNQISVQSAENNLTTAEQNLSYTSVRAPMDGVVSAIGVTVGQTAGSSAVTLVSNNNVAQVTLNEDDAAKVLTGDKATLTFDAIYGLSLAGDVIEIDAVGTVSQGVVSYNAQISFSQPANTSSSQLVKPGMSVTADIVTNVAQNVIAVPNAALTTIGSSTYILEPSTALAATDLSASASGGIIIDSVKRVPVTTGLANDTMTEITSGIHVGDQIIVQAIKSTTAAKTATPGSTSALQLLGGATRGGGGFTRGAAVP